VAAVLSVFLPAPELPLLQAVRTTRPQTPATQNALNALFLYTMFYLIPVVFYNVGKVTPKRTHGFFIL
jgi:hypothetical protein